MIKATHRFPCDKVNQKEWIQANQVRQLTKIRTKHLMNKNGLSLLYETKKNALSSLFLRFFSYSSTIFLYLFYNIFLEMSIRKIIGMDNGVNDFSFQIAPRSITLPKDSKAFRLYLQKGMQILGKFQNDTSTPLKDSFYRFRTLRPVQFRMTNLHHANYTWSLYLINPNTLEQIFSQSVSFNVERTVKLYQMELLQKEREIQTSFRQKTINKGMIIQLWNQAKKEMKTFRSIQKCVFSNQSQIQFQVQIKNFLDVESEKEAAQKEHLISLRRQRSADFSSSNGSDVKVRQQNASEIKPKRHLKPKIIQVNTSPYQTTKKCADQIVTKETIELEFDPTIDNINEHIKSRLDFQQKSDQNNFNATVKIVNPSGEEIDVKAHEQREQNDQRPRPKKKFSLLSDIVQLSYEGSSSYGHPDANNSTGFNTEAVRKDGTMDYIIENELKPNEGPGLSKFKTLPYQSSHNRLSLGEEFRRAQTAQRHHNDGQSSQLQEESIISGSEIKIQPQIQKKKPSSGDPYGKWIILAAMLIIIGIISGQFFSEQGKISNAKKRSKRRKEVS